MTLNLERRGFALWGVGDPENLVKLRRLSGAVAGTQELGLSEARPSVPGGSTSREAGRARPVAGALPGMTAEVLGPCAQHTDGCRGASEPVEGAGAPAVLLCLVLIGRHVNSSLGLPSSVQHGRRGLGSGRHGGLSRAWDCAGFFSFQPRLASSGGWRTCSRRSASLFINEAGPAACPVCACSLGLTVLPSLGSKDNQHWNHLIQDAQRRGAIIKTCDKNYKQDVIKTLKLKSVLQRSVTYPPPTAPEGSSPQGSSLLRTWQDDAPNQASLDAREAAGKDPDRPPVKDQPRDPRLFRRMEAPGNCPRNPEPWGPQHPGAASASGEPSFPATPQAPGHAVEPCTATGSSHSPHVPCVPPAASVDSTNQSDQKGGHSHQRESRAFSDRDQELLSPGSRHPKRSASWDDGRTREEDSGWKKRKL